MEVLRIEGLSKIFGTGRLEVRALEDINLSVSPPEIWWPCWDPAAPARPPCCSAPA